MDKVIYFDSQDIKRFLESSREEATGVSYEWLDENVFSIHLIEVLNHPGARTSALFVREKLPEASSSDCRFAIVAADGGSVFENVNGSWCPRDADRIPDEVDYFSRNHGVLEHRQLKDKTVAIIGIGSGGSLVTTGIVTAGVSHIILVDNQRLEPHNLVRHVGGLQDLGRYKTKVLKDAILNKNPYAHVETYECDITAYPELLRSIVKKSDIVFVAPDNNKCRLCIQEALVEFKKVGIFGRAITRAEGGDVFIYRPGGPCYCCIVGKDALKPEEITDEASARANGTIPAYMTPEDVENVVQVGLYSDIIPIANMMVKQALVILSHGTDCGLSSLEEDFVYPLYIWANRREVHFANWHTFYKAGPDKTIMRWYGVNIKKDPGCAICSENMVLDTGE